MENLYSPSAFACNKKPMRLQYFFAEIISFISGFHFYQGRTTRYISGFSAFITLKEVGRGAHYSPSYKQFINSYLRNQKQKWMVKAEGTTHFFNFWTILLRIVLIIIVHCL